MSALAVYFQMQGFKVRGSDIPEVFVTDALLKEHRIPFHEGFKASRLPVPEENPLIIHSAAYTPDNNPELKAALENKLPVFSYPQALGGLSALTDASAVAGVHGKTGTTALIGTLIRQTRLPASLIAGSSVAGFNGGSIHRQGERYLIAECCEYRRNFLSFRPRRILLTGIEMDHPDYFRDLRDITAAFREFCLTLPPGGELIYCRDQSGALSLAQDLAEERPDLRLTPYGFDADTAFGIVAYRREPGKQIFRLRGFSPEWSLPVPGKHTVLNAAGALALVLKLGEDFGEAPEEPFLNNLGAGLRDFKNGKRRCEIKGNRDGILFMDDYAHHPTAVRCTLEGLKEFYPGRRLVVDFMPHTYSRTARLLDEFTRSFREADQVILHDIYASARETKGAVSGEDFYRALRRRHPHVHYFPRPETTETAAACRELLRPNDLFITMGAGDNWKLGETLLHGSSGDGLR